jgi:hypothetical protein
MYGTVQILLIHSARRSLHCPHGVTDHLPDQMVVDNSVLNVAETPTHRTHATARGHSQFVTQLSPVFKLQGLWISKVTCIKVPPLSASPTLYILRTFIAMLSPTWPRQPNATV